MYVYIHNIYTYIYIHMLTEVSLTAFQTFGFVGFRLTAQSQSPHQETLRPPLPEDS